MSKYIHNKSTAIVSLIDRKIEIPIGGKISVTDQEASHEDVIHAVRKGWISVEGVKSSSAAPAAPAGITLAKDEMKGSTTIPVVEKRETATSSSLGATETESKPKKTKKTEATV